MCEFFLFQFIISENYNGVIIKNHNDDAGYYSSKFGLPVPNSPYGLCGRKTTLNSNSRTSKAQELRESHGGRPELPIPNSPYGLCVTQNNTEFKDTELRSCMKVEVAVLGSPSLIILMVSVDVKQR